MGPERTDTSTPPRQPPLLHRTTRTTTPPHGMDEPQSQFYPYIPRGGGARDDKVEIFPWMHASLGVCTFLVVEKNQFGSSSKGVCYIITRVLRYVRIIYQVPPVDVSVSTKAARNFPIRSAVKLAPIKRCNASPLAVRRACAFVVMCESGRTWSYQRAKSRRQSPSAQSALISELAFRCTKAEQNCLQSAHDGLGSITKRKICTDCRVQNLPIHER